MGSFVGELQDSGRRGGLALEDRRGIIDAHQERPAAEAGPATELKALRC